MIKNGFVKKNVGTLTLGERLSKIRSEKRITLAEASRGTRIQSKYLEYLENGNYDKLPADVYVKGFLRSYGQFLGMDENYLIRLYDREKEIHRNIKKEDSEKKVFRPVKSSSVIVSPKILVVSLIIFFVGLGFFYLYRELSIFISNPRLVVLEPTNNFSTEERMITIEGITEKDAHLSINGQGAIVNEEGKFSESIVLQPGLNTIVVKSNNRFNKESESIITGEARFEVAAPPLGDGQSGENQENQPQSEETEKKKVTVELYGDTKQASITVKTDDIEVFRGKISPGETKSFEAENRIILSVDKGKYVGVRVDGTDLGLLSKDTKPIANRVFSAQ